MADRPSRVRLENSIQAVINPATEDKQDDLSDSIILLRRMVKLLESSAVVDANMRQRVAVDNILAFSGSGTPLGGIGAGSPGVNSITAAAPAATNVSYTPVWVGPVDQRYVLMDQSRNTYANAIRPNLSFS